MTAPNTPASNDFVLVQAERDRFREALEDVCNPIRHFQRMADAEGARLSGMAYSLANDISTVQRIARAALAAAPASPEPASNEAPGRGGVENPSADGELLDWLEHQARKSPTGISFDWVPACEGEPSGFRFMRRHFIGDQAKTLREAITFAVRKIGGAA